MFSSNGIKTALRIAAVSLGAAYTAYQCFKYMKYVHYDLPAFKERRQLERKRDEELRRPPRFRDEFLLASISDDEFERPRPSTSSDVERPRPMSFPEHDILEGIYDRPNRNKLAPPRIVPGQSIAENRDETESDSESEERRHD